MVWVVDPMAESVTIHRGRDEMCEFRDDDVVEGGDVVQGFRVPVRELFPGQP